MGLKQKIVARAVGSSVALRWVDLGLGFALMRDGRIPMRVKAMTLGIGAALTAALVAAELPLEAMLALAIPLAGAGVDMIVDGAEEAIGAMIISAILLPHMAPRDLVDQIRAERASRA